MKDLKQIAYIAICMIACFTPMGIIEVELVRMGSIVAAVLLGIPTFVITVWMLNAQLDIENMPN